MLPRPISKDIEPAFRDRMTQYVALLDRWRHVTNLISTASFEDIWTRHIADCAQLRSYSPQAKIWMDIGSGAGLPGLVIAAQLVGIDGACVHCVESDARKCAFLRDAIRTLGLPAVVHARRIEEVRPEATGHIDVITSRAVAPLAKLLEYAAPFFERDTFAIFPRGQSEGAIFDSLQETAFRVERFPNAIEPRAHILRIQRNR